MSKQETPRSDASIQKAEEKGETGSPVRYSSGRHAVALLLICVVGVLAYLPSFKAPFLYDDLPEIIGNHALIDLFDWRTVVLYNPARALLMLTFAVDLHFWGLNPLPFHVENLIIHLINTLLVYRIGERLLNRPGRRTLPAHPGSPSGLEAPAGWSASLAVALIFAVHPLFVEAVTYIASRSSSLATLFYLAGFAAYVRFRDQQADGARGAGVWLGLALNAYFLSLFTKEEGVSLPAALLAFDLLIGSRQRTQADERADASGGENAGASGGANAGASGAERAGASGSQPRTSWWLASLPFWVLCVVMAGTRLKLYGTLEQTVIHRSLAANLWTEIEVLAQYLRLMVLPYGLSIYHDYPVVANPGQASTLLALALHAGLITAIVACWRKRPLVSFGILWFYLTLTPTSSFIPLKETMAEHRMYLAGVGLLLVFGAGLRTLRDRYRLPPLLVGAALAVPLMLMTFRYNGLWQDERALWERALELAPHSGDAAYALGDAYNRRGELDRAEQAYQKAIHNYEVLRVDLSDQKYNYVDAINNLGLVFGQRGNLDMAISYFRRALHENVRYTQAWNNLALAQMRKNLPLEASFSFEEVLKIAPDNWLAHYYLGKLYYESLSDPKRAASHYKRVLEINPNFPGADVVKNRVLELGM